MNDAHINEILPLLAPVKYIHTKSQRCDYSSMPRPAHNIAFMLEGEGEIGTGNDVFRVKAGDILYVPKNSTYTSHWIAQPKTVFHTLHFLFHPKNDPLADKNIPVQILPCENFDESYDLLLQIEKHRTAVGAEAFIALSAFYSLCATLLKEVMLLPSERVDQTIAPAIRYLERNHSEKISVESLAALCFISPSRFYYLFKKQTGISPVAYKNRLSVQCAAKDLLFDKEEKIENIARRYGFSSLIYFERAFKKFTGKSPSRYRKEDTLL